MIRDTYRTSLCLRLPPHILAALALLFTCQVCRLTFPDDRTLHTIPEDSMYILSALLKAQQIQKLKKENDNHQSMDVVTFPEDQDDGDAKLNQQAQEYIKSFELLQDEVQTLWEAAYIHNDQTPATMEAMERFLIEQVNRQKGIKGSSSFPSAPAAPSSSISPSTAPSQQEQQVAPSHRQPIPPQISQQNTLIPSSGNKNNSDHNIQPNVKLETPYKPGYRHQINNHHQHQQPQQYEQLQNDQLPKDTLPLPSKYNQTNINHTQYQQLHNIDKQMLSNISTQSLQPAVPPPPPPLTDPSTVPSVLPSLPDNETSMTNVIPGIQNHNVIQHNMYSKTPTIPSVEPDIHSSLPVATNATDSLGTTTNTTTTMTSHSTVVVPQIKLEEEQMQDIKNIDTKAIPPRSPLLTLMPQQDFASHSQQVKIEDGHSAPIYTQAQQQNYTIRNSDLKEEEMDISLFPAVPS